MDIDDSMKYSEIRFLADESPSRPISFENSKEKDHEFMYSKYLSNMNLVLAHWLSQTKSKFDINFLSEMKTVTDPSIVLTFKNCEFSVKAGCSIHSIVSKEIQLKLNPYA